MSKRTATTNEGGVEMAGGGGGGGGGRKYPKLAEGDTTRMWLKPGSNTDLNRDAVIDFSVTTGEKETLRFVR
jgi:hypothetical protein